MAVSKRNAGLSHAQEPPLTITRVALYARVSTLNGQDPEMQLSELREYASRRGQYHVPVLLHEQHTT